MKKLLQIYFVKVLTITILFFVQILGTSYAQEKGMAALTPMGALGKFSEMEKQIIFNSLQESLSTRYTLASQKAYEAAETQAFEELDYDECTEDQCFALIQQILQVDNLFLFNMTREGNFTQLSLTRVDLDSQRLVRTSSCADCNIEQLNTKVEELVMKLIAEDQIAIAGTKITPEPKPDPEPTPKLEPEPAVEPEKSTSSEKNLFANSERMRVRFDSSLVGNHEGNFIHGEETEKSLTLQTLSMIFKNNFGVGLSTINWAGTTTFLIYDLKNWGVNGNILDFYYMFEEKNPNTYWIDQMPLSLTLGTSYPLSLEMKWGMGYKDDDPSLFNQLISIGVKVTDDFELILNGRYYGFTAQNGERFNLTAYTLGIGYLF